MDLPPEQHAAHRAPGSARHHRRGQLLDPAGLVFCVVGVQTGPEFQRYATSWP